MVSLIILPCQVLYATKDEFEFLRRFTFSEYDNLSGNDKFDDFKKDDLLNQNWNINLLAAPELNFIPYIANATHVLFVDSNYSISDIIRMKSVKKQRNKSDLNE